MVNTFAEAFWSPDYKAGISVIYDKLRQGCEENSQILAMITDHIALEKTFAAGLQSFPDKHIPTSNRGFGRDEGASLRQAYVSILDEISNRGFIHSRIAEDMDKSIRRPLSKWIQGHNERVSDSQTVVMNKIHSYLRKEVYVQKLQQLYFAKCRQLEDGLEGRSEPPDLSKLRLFRTASSPKSASSRDTSDSSILRSISALHIFNLGGMEYSPETLGVLLHSMLEEIPRQQYKIPIIGKYDDVSTGENICLWMRKTLPFKNIASAEKFGQSLLNYGFFKPIGLGTRSFLNSSNLYYQWQKKALVFEESDSLDRSDEDNATLSPDEASNFSTDSDSTAISSSLHTTYTHHLQLRKEIDDADTQYRQEIIALDERRCDLERAIHRALTFVQQCEQERLECIKKAFKTFKNILVHNNSEYADIYDRMGLFQESIHPQADLQYLVNSYKTSYFIPKTVAYRNFDPSIVIQTFGVNLTDVPFVIPWFLNYISSKITQPVVEKPAKQVRFEDHVELKPLENWTNNSVSLSDIHQLRKQLNTGSPANESSLDLFTLHTVIQTFKEFLLELPDTVISFTIYDLIKNIYQKNQPELSDRLDLVAGALAQLSRTSIDGLRQIVRHFTDLNSIYELDFSEQGDGSLHDLCISLAPCIFRPRVITGLNMDDKHPHLLLKDIFQNHERLFESVALKQEEHQRVRRERAMSGSETTRRAAAEERSRRLGSGSMPFDREESPAKSGNKLRPLTLSPVPRTGQSPRSKKRIPVNVGLSPSSPDNSLPGTPETIRYKMIVSSPKAYKELPEIPVDANGGK